MSEGETVDSTDATAVSGDLPRYFCGDSVVNEDEECDDGNAQDGDACRNDCTRRWIVFITSEPSKPLWTRGAEVMCGASAAIYCFEQP